MDLVSILIALFYAALVWESYRLAVSLYWLFTRVIYRPHDWQILFIGGIVVSTYVAQRQVFYVIYPAGVMLALGLSSWRLLSRLATQCTTAGRFVIGIICVPLIFVSLNNLVQSPTTQADVGFSILWSIILGGSAVFGAWAFDQHSDSKK